MHKATELRMITLLTLIAHGRREEANELRHMVEAGDIHDGWLRMADLLVEQRAQIADWREIAMGRAEVKS